MALLALLMFSSVPQLKTNIVPVTMKTRKATIALATISKRATMGKNSECKSETGRFLMAFGHFSGGHGKMSSGAARVRGAG